MKRESGCGGEEVALSETKQNLGSLTYDLFRKIYNMKCYGDKAI
jgi:hypothetical protein